MKGGLNFSFQPDPKSQIGTAKMLLRDPKIQEGFANLYELGRLDLTVEALVVDPIWKELFEPEEIEIVRRRLENWAILKMIQCNEVILT